MSSGAVLVKKNMPAQPKDTLVYSQAFLMFAVVHKNTSWGENAPKRIYFNKECNCHMLLSPLNSLKFTEQHACCS